ncbi:MAG: ferrous iron transport protein B [Candidatus Krumholzibacteria bacterium]|jgi:ferrous iron transport protein B|nr:ferrous iron transport protein B [Candidatus Krumholzibacteria bacterium]MDP6668876.1 ferrous iron transport protein B [Candidatus Krumholzibacteria bacterium]MDP6797015.1 ferrous iron transport protein B [Candidatus Krumholzibacteria bacterium]MDP7022218.1 ferrous iron transport protein B [Candidatus Krumholzibacteria bacterium]
MSSESTVRDLRVAIAGNPNSGKTSLFNHLTGGRQHVGNYPGVTVEKKWGRRRDAEGTLLFVDLPGTYSLTSLSEEERVARSYLINERPDLVVNVLDASSLERNLYLSVQLMELEMNLVLALNMIDEANALGAIIDRKSLEELTGAPVVETQGHRGRGVEDLLRQIRKNDFRSPELRQVNYGPVVEKEIETLLEDLAEIRELPLPARYVAIKLLEEDRQIGEGVREDHPRPDWLMNRVREARDRILTSLRESAELVIADRRHGFAAGLAREILLRRPREDRITESERLDSVLTHRFLGLPIFLAMMFALFWLTFRLGDPLMGLIESLFAWLASSIAGFWPSDQWPVLRSLLLEGIIGGVGGVLVFLPNIILLFLGISLLEDTGYMSRAAFLMDRLMHRFGLHGKSFIPMLIGFGCTVPAIMATRTLESRRDRLITMMILPFISCGARLPIFLLLIPAFFPRSWQAPVLWGLYILGILLGLLMALILRKTIFGGREAPFVMELPPYRRPGLRNISLHMWQRSLMYLKKAGTIILAISVLLWVLGSFPKLPHDAVIDGFESREAAELAYSLSGRIGHSLEPLTSALGFDWKVNTAFLGAFAAKEVFVAQMGIVYSMGEEEEDLRKLLARHYSPLQGLSILVFALLASPCVATLAITRKESGRWRWALLQWGGLTATAWILSFLIFQIGSLLGVGT